MAGAVRTEAYRALLAALVNLRGDVGLSQADLAERLGKPPSYVAKYELGERRLDVIELLVLLKTLGADHAEVLSQLEAVLPDRL